MRVRNTKMCSTFHPLAPLISESVPPTYVPPALYIPSSSTTPTFSAPAPPTPTCTSSLPEPQRSSRTNLGKVISTSSTIQFLTLA